MGNSQKTISVEKAIEYLKDVLVKKGYPQTAFLENNIINFSYNNLKFIIEIPLIVRENNRIYFLVDYKPMEKLTFFERGLLALARLFFNPLPYFGLVSNLKTYALINFYKFEVIKGSTEIIPDYHTILSYEPETPKKFSPELEKKILAIYLSGG